jgi:HEAT repeat protein
MHQDLAGSVRRILISGRGRLQRRGPRVGAAALLALGIAVAAASAGEQPVRVCLPSAPYNKDGPSRMTPAERTQGCIALHFRERLSRLPNVEVMSDEWANAVLFFGGQDMRGHSAEPTFADFRAGAPVDVVVLCREQDGKLLCSVLSERGSEAVPGPATTDSVAWLQAVAAKLGPALGLDAKASGALVDFGSAPAAMVEACLLSQRIVGAWVTNSGDAQLGCLRPFIQDVGKHPVLASAVLRAGVALSKDSRKPENAARCVEMLRLALVVALGTPIEEEAVAYVRQAAHGRETIEKELAELVVPLATDEADALLEAVALLEAADGKGTGEVLIEKDRPQARGSTGLPKRIGAIRCLAGMQSARLKALLPRLAAHEDPAVRAAAAYALADVDSGANALIGKLAADRNSAVAFAGKFAAWRRGHKSAPVLAEARSLFTAGSRTPEIVDVLASLGTEEDEPRLRSLLTGTMEERRKAFEGLARCKRLSGDDFRACLGSVDDTLLAFSLQHMDAKTAAACRDRLVALANQSHGVAAEAARGALRPLRPTDPQAQAAFDLEVEHLYLRLRAVEHLAQGKEAWASGLLEMATTNADPQVRAQALLALQAKAPDAALKVLPRLLQDPALWVRVHASSLVASLKSPGLEEAVAAALKTERDPTCRTYLEQAQGKAPPKAVNRFDPERTRFGLCGYASQAVQSPLGWYYSLNSEVNEAGRKAHEAGKILIGRANHTAPNPVQVIFHPIWRDLWWTSLRKELKDLEWLDGVVLGEESMYARPWDLWNDGWRCFCVEAGIDAGKVGADRSKLNPAETRAYLDWEQERAIDGFNRMYDFIKLDLGARRPGFQVATFMPDQNGPNIAEHRWKFDVGGAYWYETNNRVRYNMIRRYRTVWPGRPLMWLVSGNAGLPLLAPVNYRLEVPEGLVLNRACNAYADSVCAWAAGAEPGYFVAWLFMGKDIKPGPSATGRWVWLEDIGQDSAALAEGTANVWKGMAEKYRLEAETRKVQGSEKDPEGTKAEARIEDDLEEKDLANDAFSKRAAAEQERFRLGFFFEQKALYDIARAFTGLLRPQEDFAALLVGGRAALPQFAALSGYDLLELVNQLPHGRLAKYRLIGIEADPEAPLRDETIVAIRTWLKEQPGLLYVHGFLSLDHANKAGTAADHDGRLQEGWPWETAITFEKDHYALKSSSAKVLAGEAASCTRALWRGEGFKGAVLFDCGKTTAEGFQELLRSLHKDSGVGLPAEGVAGMIRANPQPIAACASDYGAQAEVRLGGVDLFTGEPNPVVAKGRSAAVTAENFQGTYAASYNGVTILCDAPIESVKPVDDGLEVRCAGLIRASSARGEVRVQPDLPRKEGNPQEILKWILFGKDKGVARLPAGAGTAAFIRGQGVIVIAAVRAK